MTFNELIQNNKDKVRSNSDLTLYFIEAYKEVFGHKPSCSGCSINNEIEKLYSKIRSRVDLLDKEIIINTEIMNQNKEITFIKSPAFTEDMIKYKKDGKDYRKFTHKLTDEFVIGYLTNGTPEELAERKTKFKVLPLALREEKQTDEVQKKGKRSKKEK